MYRRQARNHGTRSPDSSPPPRHSRSKENEASNPEATVDSQTATAETRAPQQNTTERVIQQLTHASSTARRSEPTRTRPLSNTSYVARTHGTVPNVTPRNTGILPPRVRDTESSDRRGIASEQTISSEPSSTRTNEATAASAHPARRDETDPGRRQRPHQNPRSRPGNNQSLRPELRVGDPGISAPTPSPQSQGRDHVDSGIVPPGDLVNAIRNGSSPFPFILRAPTPQGSSFARTSPSPATLPRSNPFLDVDDNYRLPPIVHSAFEESNERSTPSVQGSRSRDSLPSSKTNRSLGSLAQANESKKQIPGSRKHPLTVEDDGDDSDTKYNNDDSLRPKRQGDPTDDEDEEEKEEEEKEKEEEEDKAEDSETEEDQDKDSSSAGKEPPLKKTKLGVKKTRKRKANPATRRTKARINHGELEDRTDGSTWFRANENAPWESTVRHEPNREAMVADARRDPADVTRDRSYDEPPAGSLTDVDRTSYLHSQRHWFYRRPHNWHHPTLDPIFYRFERGDRPFRQDTIGPLRWRGKIVLNSKNIVISDYPDLPLTLSSKIEGWRMEAIMRLDERISAEDFRDRMPTRKNVQPPQVASALGNHRSRFREANGLASWDTRDGSKGYTEAIRGKLTRKQRDNNTTEGFDRLSPKTLTAIREANRENAKGAYARRAGLKLLTEEERRKRAEGKKPTRSKITLSKKTTEAPKAQPSTAPQSQPPQTRQSQEDPSAGDEKEQEEDETEYDGDEDDSAL